MSASGSAQPPRIFTPEYYARMRELEARSWWNEGMRDIARSLLDRARLGESGLLVDAGCGSGQTMTWFQHDHPKWTVAGIDVSGDAITVAARGLSICQASALALPFGDSTVDAVISLDVLQHLPFDGGDAIAVREFRRVLRSGGALLIRTNAQSIPRTPPDERNSFRKYSPATVRRLLVRAGFDVAVLGRCNAVLGLAEIPRELAAARGESEGYRGILAEPHDESAMAHRLKRGWLRFEGKAMKAGLPLPLGRTLFALCRARA